MKKDFLKIRQHPKHVSLEDLEQLLTDYGFVPRGGKGSHMVYQHPDEANPIVVAVHGKHVPAYIVKQVLDVIDRLIDQEQNDDSEND